MPRNKQVKVVLPTEMLDRINQFGGRQSQTANVRAVLASGLAGGKIHDDDLMVKTIKQAIHAQVSRSMSPIASIAYKTAYVGYMIVSLLLLALMATGIPRGQVYEIYAKVRQRAHRSLRNMDSEDDLSDTLSPYFDKIIDDEINDDEIANSAK